jgi:hypothetical protein
VLAEPPDPHLIEHRPVALQRPHDDARVHDVTQGRPGGSTSVIFGVLRHQDGPE